MEKPITLRRKDFIDRITDAINDSGLPAFVVRDILKMFDAEMSAIEKRQYQDDLRMWTISKVAENPEGREGDNGNTCCSNNGDN